MNDGILDAFHHNAWATRELLKFCEQLSREQLQASAIGTYGSILETFNHMIEADSYYFWLMTGEQLGWDWTLDGSASIPQLQQSAAGLGEAWERFLQEPFNGNLELARTSPQGEESRDRSGIVLAQAIHHPNVHREQVNMMLTAQGIEPPDLDVWMFDSVSKGNPPP